LPRQRKKTRALSRLASCGSSHAIGVATETAARPVPRLILTY